MVKKSAQIKPSLSKYIKYLKQCDESQYPNFASISEYLPLFIESSIDWMLIVKILIKSEYLKSFSTFECTQCHSLTLKTRNFLEYMKRSQQKHFKLVHKKTRDNSTRQRWNFPIVWECEMKSCKKRFMVNRDSQIGIFRQTRDLGILLKLIAVGYLTNMNTSSQCKQYGVSRKRIVGLRRVFGRQMIELSSIEEGNELQYNPFNFYTEYSKQTEFEYKNQHNTFKRSNALFSNNEIANQYDSWKKNIKKLREDQGFNKYLGLTNAVEMDQSKWCYNSTHKMGTHSVRLREYLWLFGCIERAVSIEIDTDLSLAKVIASNVSYSNWLNAVSTNKVLKKDFNIPIKDTLEIENSVMESMKKFQTEKPPELQDIFKLYLNLNTQGIDQKEINSIQSSIQMGIKNLKTKRRHVRVKFMGRNYKSIIEQYLAEWVQNNAIIYSDSDSKFNSLSSYKYNGENYGYRNIQVLHRYGQKVRFEKNGTSAAIHSQTIERFWKYVKSFQRMRKKVHRRDFEFTYNEAKYAYEYKDERSIFIFQLLKDSPEKIQYSYKGNKNIGLLFNSDKKAYSTLYPEIFDENSIIKNDKTSIGIFSLNSYDNRDTWALQTLFKKDRNEDLTCEAFIKDVSDYGEYGKKFISTCPLNETFKDKYRIVEDLPHYYNISKVKNQSDYQKIELLKSKFNIKRRSTIYKTGKGPIDPSLENVKDKNINKKKINKKKVQNVLIRKKPRYQRPVRLKESKQKYIIRRKSKLNKRNKKDNEDTSSDDSNDDDDHPQFRHDDDSNDDDDDGNTYGLKLQNIRRSIIDVILSENLDGYNLNSINFGLSQLEKLNNPIQEKKLERIYKLLKDRESIIKSQKSKIFRLKNTNTDLQYLNKEKTELTIERDSILIELQNLKNLHDTYLNTTDILLDNLNQRNQVLQNEISLNQKKLDDIETEILKYKDEMLLLSIDSKDKEIQNKKIIEKKLLRIKELENDKLIALKIHTGQHNHQLKLLGKERLLKLELNNLIAEKGEAIKIYIIEIDTLNKKLQMNFDEIEGLKKFITSLENQLYDLSKAKMSEKQIYNDKIEQINKELELVNKQRLEELADYNKNRIISKDKLKDIKNRYVKDRTNYETEILELKSYNHKQTRKDKDTIKGLGNQIEKLEKELKLQISKAKKNQKDSKLEFDKIQNQLAKKRKSKLEIFEKYLANEKLIKELEFQFQQKIKDIESNQIQKLEDSEELKKLRNLLKLLEIKLEKRNKQKQDLKLNNQILINELSLARTKLDESKEAILLYKNAIIDLNKELTITKRNISVRDELITKNREEINILHDTIKKLNDELNSINAKKDKKIRKLQENIQIYKDAIINVHNDFNIAKLNISNRDETITEYRNDIKKLNIELDKKNKDLGNLLKNSELKSSENLHILSNALDIKELELVENIKQWEIINDNNERIKNELILENDKLNKRVSDLELNSQRFKVLQNKLENITKDYDHSLIEINSLYDTITNLNNTKYLIESTLKGEIKDLNTKIAELTTILNDMVLKQSLENGILERTKKEILELIENASSKSFEILSKNSEIELLSQRLKEIEKDKENIENELNTIKLQGSIDEKKNLKINKLLQETNDEFKLKFNELLRDIDKLNQDCIILTDQRDKYFENITELTIQVKKQQEVKNKDKEIYENTLVEYQILKERALSESILEIKELKRHLNEELNIKKSLLSLESEIRDILFDKDVEILEFQRKLSENEKKTTKYEKKISKKDKTIKELQNLIELYKSNVIEIQKSENVSKSNKSTSALFDIEKLQNELLIQSAKFEEYKGKVNLDIRNIRLLNENEKNLHTNEMYILKQNMEIYENEIENNKRDNLRRDQIISKLEDDIRKINVRSNRIEENSEKLIKEKEFVEKQMQERIYELNDEKELSKNTIDSLIFKLKEKSDYLENTSVYYQTQLLRAHETSNELNEKINEIGKLKEIGDKNYNRYEFIITEEYSKREKLQELLDSIQMEYSLEKELNINLDKRIEFLKSQIFEHETEIVVKNKEITKHLTDLQQKEEILISIANENTVLVNVSSLKSMELQKLQAANEILKEKELFVSVMEYEIQNLHFAIEGNEKKIKELNNTIYSHTDEMNDIRNRCILLNNKNEESEKNVQTLHDSVETLTVYISTNNTLFESKIKEKTDQIDVLRNQMIFDQRSYEKFNKSMQFSYKNKEIEFEKYKKDIESQFIKNDTQHQEMLDSYKLQYEKQQEKFLQSIEEFENSIKKKTFEIQNAKRMQDETYKDNESTMIQILKRSTKHEIELLHQDIERKNSNIRRLEIEIKEKNVIFSDMELSFKRENIILQEKIQKGNLKRQTNKQVFEIEYQNVSEKMRILKENILNKEAEFQNFKNEREVTIRENNWKVKELTEELNTNRKYTTEELTKNREIINNLELRYDESVKTTEKFKIEIENIERRLQMASETGNIIQVVVNRGNTKEKIRTITNLTQEIQNLKEMINVSNKKLQNEENNRKMMQYEFDKFYTGEYLHDDISANTKEELLQLIKKDRVYLGKQGAELKRMRVQLQDFTSTKKELESVIIRRDYTRNSIRIVKDGDMDDVERFNIQDIDSQITDPFRIFEMNNAAAMFIFVKIDLPNYSKLPILRGSSILNLANTIAYSFQYEDQTPRVLAVLHGLREIILDLCSNGMLHKVMDMVITEFNVLLNKARGRQAIENLVRAAMRRIIRQEQSMPQFKEIIQANLANMVFMASDPVQLKSIAYRIDEQQPKKRARELSDSEEDNY